MGGLTSPKGGNTLTSTAQQTVPGYASDAQKNLLGYGNAITGSVLNAGTPQYTQAGFNADQSGAYDLTRYLAQQTFQPGGTPTNAPNLLNYSPAIGGNASTYDAALAPAAQGYGATSATAAQVGANDYQRFMTPYTQSVIDPAVQQLRRQHDITSAQIGAQAAAAGAFGGSGEAVQQSENDRVLGDQSSSLVAQLMSQGYTQAQAMAQANAQLQQQANLQNASAGNQADQFNAGAINSVNMQNAGMRNSASQFNSGANNSMALANAGMINDAAKFNVGQSNTAVSLGQNAAQIQSGLDTADQNRKLAAIQAMLGIGNAQQTTQQGYLNQPLQYLQALAALTPQNYGGTTTETKPNTAASPLQTLLGIGTSLGGAVLGGKL